MRSTLAAIVILVACERTQTSTPEPRDDPSAGISAQRTAPQLPVPGPPPPPPPPPLPGPMPPPDAIARFIGEPDENPWIVSIDRRRLTAAETAIVIERLISKTSYIDGAAGCFTNDPTHITLQRGKRRLALETSCTNVLLAGEHIATFDPETATYLENLRSARAAPRTPPRTRSR